MTKAVNESLYLSSYQEKTRNINNNLGKDEFLKILMVQMRNQDPTEPLKDTEYIAQLAQFSSLEQMTNMTSAIEKLVTAQNESQLISYNQFIGKEVTWHDVFQEDGENIVYEGTGKIVAITYNGGDISFTLDNGNSISTGNITSLKESTNENYVVQASLMIGKKITFLGENSMVGNGLIESVSFKNGQPIFELEDGSKVTSKQITKVE